MTSHRVMTEKEVMELKYPHGNMPHTDGPRKQRRKKIKNRCKRIKKGRR